MEEGLVEEVGDGIALAEAVFVGDVEVGEGGVGGGVVLAEGGEGFFGGGEDGGGGGEGEDALTVGEEAEGAVLGDLAAGVGVGFFPGEEGGVIHVPSDRP